MNFPQRLRSPFNDVLFIQRYDPIKQYYTVEATSNPGRPIIAPIEALHSGEDFVIAARYYENDKNVSTQGKIKLHEYQNQILEGEDSERLHQLSQLLVSDLTKTIILYEKMFKQLTTDIAHTDDPTSSCCYKRKQRQEQFEIIRTV